MYLGGNFLFVRCLVKFSILIVLEKSNTFLLTEMQELERRGRAQSNMECPKHNSDDLTLFFSCEKSVINTVK